MNEIVEIASYGTTFAARAAVAHLESEGIKASVVTDNAGGAIPSMSTLSGGVRIVVSRDDAEQATAILSEHFSSEEVEEAEEAGDQAQESSNA
jgi:hypothetical protein